jgi:hypothetical protein
MSPIQTRRITTSGDSRGSAFVTTALDVATRASEEVRAILATANVIEMKWENLRTAGDRAAAIQVAEWLFSTPFFF